MLICWLILLPASIGVAFAESEGTGFLFNERTNTNISPSDNRCIANGLSVACTSATEQGTLLSQVGIFGCHEKCVSNPNNYPLWSCGSCNNQSSIGTMRSQNEDSIQQTRIRSLASPTTKTPVRPSTSRPTKNPITSKPVTSRPTRKPVSLRPTRKPVSLRPTRNPVTRRPTKAPITSKPVTTRPTRAPITRRPTRKPVTMKPVSSVQVIVPPSPSVYNIYLDLVGAPKSTQVIFTNAAKRWTEITTADLSDISSSDLDPPPQNGCKYPSIIDDLYVCAVFSNIDGVGEILGYAGPEYIRDSDGLSITGAIVFDLADVASLEEEGLFELVVLHGLGHVLGIGSLWQYQGIQGPDNMNCPYNGTNAIREYKALTGCDTIPIETDYGDGTRCGHWDEECLDAELMTGLLNDGVNSLSRISIASLQDLGYPIVNYSKADPYTRIDVNSSCLCNRRLEGVAIGKTGYKKRNKRKLSSEGYQLAYNYGMEILKSNAKLHSESIEYDRVDSNPTSAQSSIKPFKYVGDDLVVVLYYEENTIYSITVKQNQKA